MPRLLFAVALVLAAASTCQSHSVSSGGEDGSVGEGEADARASELWGQITAATNAGDWPQARALLDHLRVILQETPSTGPGELCRKCLFAFIALSSSIVFHALGYC